MKAVRLFPPPGITSLVSAVAGVDDRRGLTLSTSTTNTPWRLEPGQGWWSEGRPVMASSLRHAMTPAAGAGKPVLRSAGCMQSLYLTSSHSDTLHLSFIPFIETCMGRQRFWLMIGRFSYAICFLCEIKALSCSFLSFDVRCAVRRCCQKRD